MPLHDTASAPSEPTASPISASIVEQTAHVVLSTLELSASPSQPLTTDPPASSRGRGRPLTLPWTQLWASLLLCALGGMRSLAQWQRFVGSRQVSGFAPVALCTNALVKRLLHAGLTPWEELWGQIQRQLDCLAVPPPPLEMASFATQILCLDETKLDRLARHLCFLRHLPRSATEQFAGKLLALFDLRAQRWLRLEWREVVTENSLVDLWPFLQDLAVGTLLLFDLGYFSFQFFDTLTDHGLWWISRYRAGTTYQLVHTFYRHHEVLDALVWLGGRSQHAGHLVRLVRFGDGQQIRLYLSNVLDPQTLPLVQIPQLYARRWDIELAFRLLKEHLGMSHWWSGKPELIKVQIWVVLILSQVLMVLRAQLADALRCDLFDLSLPLLLELLPAWTAQPLPLRDIVVAQGRDLGLLRPHTRLAFSLRLPTVDVTQYCPAPTDLQWHRPPLYRPYTPRKHAPSRSGYHQREEKAKARQAQRQAAASPASTSPPPS